jgi:uncharacterized ion transporter superfamily protein YfcC
MPTTPAMPQRRFKVPHTLVLLFAMVVAALVLSWLLPPGTFERVEPEPGQVQVVPGTFRETPEVERQSPLAVFTAIPKGFSAAHQIIFFVLIIGGAFAVMRATGAIDAALGSLLRRLGGRPFLLVAGGVVLFAAGSATIGMAEEYLPFVPILIVLALALGYDSVTAVGIMTVGYAIGYGVAVLNPFTVLIAQDVAGLTPASGMGFRLVLAAVFLPVGIHHVWAYAKRVKADPTRSLVADVGGPAGAAGVTGAAGATVGPGPGPAGGSTAAGGAAGSGEGAGTGAGHPRMTGTHRWVLLAVAAMLVLLIVGLSLWDWYLVEMGALFVAMAVVIAAIARMSPDRTAVEFGRGAAELTLTALMIGVARAIQVVLDEGGVVDTIVHGISLPLQALPGAASAVGMFFVQSLANLFIPSGSGQAFVTMPIMAPLADLVGVSRQVAVLAYQFGDGFTNILVPTNAVLVGILSMAAIPYDRWLRFILPFMVKMWIVGSVALVVAVWIGYT